MTVEMDIIYKGDLHCEATHRDSRSTLLTDAPKDNGGKGEAFSPPISSRRRSAHAL